MVFTFYSYKGGVGRSMSLANVGKWLSLQGLRVVMIDWDLEAPGLETFFFERERAEEVRDQVGLIDLLVSYRRTFPRLRDKLTDAVTFEDKVATLESLLPPLAPALHPLHEMGHTAGDRGALYLLTAGWRAGSKFTAYAHAVQEFNWDGFYHDYEGEAYFEWMRRQLLATDVADVVLVDSRTGVTEMGGVCTRQLADAVAIFVAPNVQNLDGVISMAADFRRPDLVARRGRPLQVVMVPSRVDNTDPTRTNAFHARFKELSQPFTPDVFTTLKSTFWALRIPYAPPYAYQERLAIGDTNSDKELEESYKRLTAHLGMVAPPHSRIRRRLSAEIQRVFGRLLPTVFVTSAPEDRERAAALRSQLEDSNISAWPDPAESITGNTDWRQVVNPILEQTRYLIVLATDAALRSEAIRQQWRRARQLGVCVIPVTVSPLTPGVLETLPQWMRARPFLDAEHEWRRVVETAGAPNTAARVPSMAPELSQYYVPRDPLLEQLSTLLLGEGVRRVALCGLPGSGKSTIAAAFCRTDAAESVFEGGILWVSAAADADVVTELQKVYGALTGDQVTFSDARDARAQVESRLANTRALFVLDDAWSAETIAAYPLDIPGCSYLVTTSDRAVALRAEAVPIELGVLSDQELRDVLHRVTPEADPQGEIWQDLITRFAAFPKAVRIGASIMTGPADAAAVDAVDAPIVRHVLDMFDREVLRRMSDEERERLILLTFAAGDGVMPLNDVASLWSADVESARATLARFRDLMLLTGDMLQSAGVNPWLRRLVEMRYPERDVGKVLENAYSRLDDRDERLARQVLCRLVRLSETVEGMRADPRAVPLTAFTKVQRDAIQRMAEVQMVTLRNPAASVVALAHEASVRQWPRLKQWIRDDEPFLVWRQRLEGYLADWRRTRDDGTLLAGVRLSEAHGWLSSRREELSDEESAFIAQSIEAQTRAVPVDAAPAMLGMPRPVALRRSMPRWPVAAAVALVLLGGSFIIWRVATMVPASEVADSPDVRATPVPTAGVEAQEQMLRADLLAERGDLTGAIAAYSAALALTPDDASILQKRGAMLCRANQPDGCIADLTKAIALQPSRADLLADRASAWAQQGDVGKALADLETAITREPGNATLYARRAALWETAGKRADALADYSKAIQLDDASSDAYFRRAAIYEATGNTSGAVADLRRVVALNADATTVRAAQARLARLGGTTVVPSTPRMAVHFHYSDKRDESVVRALGQSIRQRGFMVASIELAENATARADVRYAPPDARTALTIGQLVESGLADAGYDVPIDPVPSAASAKGGRIDVWLPSLALPSAIPSLRQRAYEPVRKK